jgi:hypothetical protein
MAKMINAQHGKRCEHGCCGNVPKAKYLGNHATETAKRVKRALKRRDRQSWKQD